MEGSIYIVLDSTADSDLSSSVICLDSDTDLKSSPGCLNPISPIVIYDSSEDEVFAKSQKSTDASRDNKCPKSPLRYKEKDSALTEEESKCSGEERNHGHSTSEKQDDCDDGTAIDKSEPSGHSDYMQSKRLASTPVEPCRKRQKLEGEKLQFSTPMSGTAKCGNTPNETPITVRYERIRCELSATKKQQQKLVSSHEELHEELNKFKKELADKEKDNLASVLVNVKTNDENETLRPIVIDGSNVAMSHGNNKVFSCKGIALCVQYFQKLGHKNITVLVPMYRKTAQAARACQIKDQHILSELESKGLLSYTPSRQLKGTRVTPYDDRFIIELACRNRGVIVSNDNYRDLMDESPEFKRVIENRLIMFVFAGDNFMVPQDPHGRYGPHLNDVLRKDSTWSQMVSPQLQKVPTMHGASYSRGPVAGLRRSPRLHRLLNHGNYIDKTHSQTVSTQAQAATLTECTSRHPSVQLARQYAAPRSAAPRSAAPQSAAPQSAERQYATRQLSQLFTSSQHLYMYMRR